MVSIRFMNLDNGKFREVDRREFTSILEAQYAVKTYAETAKFSHVKFIDGEDDGFRFTARTPGGRGGRNIAYGEFV
jgi:hypothetical protein